MGNLYFKNANHKHMINIKTMKIKVKNWLHNNDGGANGGELKLIYYLTYFNLNSYLILISNLYLILI